MREHQAHIMDALLYRINWLGLAVFVFQHLGVCDVAGLKSVVLKVPEAIAVGETVTLVCDYDLEDSPLYTVKWYQGDEEFYRYVPKESPPTKVFPTPNINVDVSRSNFREVTLNNVQRNLTGFYKCEVSADAPTFHTEIRFAHMIVAEVPRGDPDLHVSSSKVAIGAQLKANCTAPYSYPAVNITWFANGIQLEPTDGIHIVNTITREEFVPTETPILMNVNNEYTVHGSFIQQQSMTALERTHSRLIVVVKPYMIREGKIHLRCLATLFTMYRKNSDAEILEDAPQLALIRRPTAPPGMEWHGAAVMSEVSVTTPILSYVIVSAILSFSLR